MGTPRKEAKDAQSGLCRCIPVYTDVGTRVQADAAQEGMCRRVAVNTGVCVGWL